VRINEDLLSFFLSQLHIRKVRQELSTVADVLKVIISTYRESKTSGQ
jgi:hypothetical protein